MRTCRSIAIDLGAESCRVSLGEWDGTRAEVRPVHRFANGAVERGGHLYWDLDRLWQGAEQGLRLSAELATSGIDAIGVDGWAVDYVRLDAAGKVLTLDAEGPSFTDGKMAKYQDMIEFKSDDHRVLSSQSLGDDGKWQRFMTANYRRRK